MLHDRRARRLIGLLLASIQLLLPGAAEVADARLVDASAPMVHVESDAGCDLSAHPLQCAICQFLLSPAAGTTAAAPRPVALDGRATASEPPAVPLRPGGHPSPLPRSPPAV